MQNKMQEIVSILENSSLITASGLTALSESKVADVESRSIAQTLVERMYEGAEDPTGLGIYASDRMQTQQLIENVLRENAILSESSNTNVQLITASIATIVRNPYECHSHRLFNTEVAATPEIVFEEIIYKVKSANQTEAVPIYDAFKEPGAFTAINSQAITAISKAGAGVDITKPSVDLLEGKSPALTVNKTIKLTGLKFAKVSDSSVVEPTSIKIKRGCTPYMDSKDSTINCTFEVTMPDNSVLTPTVSVRIKNARFAEQMTASYCGNTYKITHFFFDASLSSDEHTHPVTLGAENSFRSYPIGTRDHIEVGETIEKIVDIKRGTGSELSGQDIVAVLADRLGDTAFRIHDDRLAKTLKDDAGFLTGTVSLKQPGTQQFFKTTEYIVDYFFTQLDGYCTTLKLMNNFDACHFVAEISPVLAQYLESERKISRETNVGGKTAFTYDVKYLSKANDILFVVAPKAPMNQVRLNLIPDDNKKTPYRTFDYYKYDSFLTDKIRRHDNPTQGAIVYSERNQEYVHNAFSIVLKVTDIPSLSSAVLLKVKEANASLVVE